MSCEKPLRCEEVSWMMEATKASFSMASSAIADVNSSGSTSALLRMASSAMRDVNSSSSMSAGSSMPVALVAIADVNFRSSMSAIAAMASSAFDAMMPSWATVDVNSRLRCLQLMLDAIVSCCNGLSDVNSSPRCLLARRCFLDGHCVRPLDRNLLDVSARRRFWAEMMPLEIFGSEGGSFSSSRCDDDA